MDGGLDALLAKLVHLLEDVDHRARDDARIFGATVNLKVSICRFVRAKKAG